MLRSVGALCCTLVMLAACGDGAAMSTDSSVDAVSSSTTSVSSVPTTATVGVAVEVAPCDLLTAEEVSLATGLNVEEVVEDPPITCIFDLGVEAGVDVFVAVDDGQGRVGGPAAVFEAYTALIEDGEAEAVADLGEGAVYAPGFRGLAVDAGGGRFIGLGINGGFQHLQDPRDVLIHLAAAALERL